MNPIFASVIEIVVGVLSVAWGLFAFLHREAVRRWFVKMQARRFGSSVGRLAEENSHNIWAVVVSSTGFVAIGLTFFIGGLVNLFAK